MSLTLDPVRGRETAIQNLALGAQSRDPLAVLIGLGLSLTPSGIGIGIVLALIHLLASLFYGVHVWNAAAFSAPPALLAASALPASYLPARRQPRSIPW